MVQVDSVTVCSYIIHMYFILASLHKGNKDIKETSLHARDDIYQLFNSRNKINSSLFILWHHCDIATD